MSELFPIVRRVRRPLVEVNPPVVVGKVEPVKAVAEPVKNQTTKPANPDETVE